MAISKEKKQQLFASYVDSLKSANSVVVVQQDAVPVAKMTEMRKALYPTGAELSVVRKRLFLRAVKEAGLQDVDLSELGGSIAVLYGAEDEMAGIKVVNDFAKLLKKDKIGSLAFLWGWYGSDWKNGEYVTELANVPSKEELLSKLVYLLNYPVQSFAAVLNQIAEKTGDGTPVVEDTPDAKTEEVVEVKEEVAGPATEEKVEEVQQEAAQETEA